MRIVLALLLSSWTVSAFAQDCVPTFYHSEPRDSQWYYGAGKGADAAAARSDALRHLAVKAVGNETAATDGALAGWEQDDYGQCGATRYALVRIEQDRVKRNLAAAPPPEEKPGPAASTNSTVVNNNNINNSVNTITVAEPTSDHHVLLLIIFLCFLIACLALVYRPKAVSYFYKPPSSSGAGVAPAPASRLREKFKAVPRQTQRDAIAEIARLGLPEYFRVHKGEGTCRPVPGTPDLLQAGVLELLRPYAAGDWKVTWENDSGFAISVKDRLVMGFAFFLYASDLPGNTDCEILYEISAPIGDTYRNQMEESLHQGLPWTVQAAAGRMGAARSNDSA